MENKTIFPIDEFVVSYKDNHFIKLTAKDGISFYYSTNEMPASSKVGDVITEYSNQITKSSVFQVTTKSNQPQKKLEQIVCQNEEIGFKIGNQFFKDEYLTYIAKKFTNACSIKKIQNIQISKWVVVEIFNHTVCLYNINNFNDKKFVADIELEQNSNYGDIYYYLTINSASGFVFDELADSALINNYASLFAKTNANLIADGQASIYFVEQQKMKEFDKTNTKLFNKTIKHKICASWQIDDVINKEDGKKYILLNDDDEQKIVSEKDLPIYAREGDFVGLTKDGKFEFDRLALLNHLQKIKKIVFGESL